MSHIRALVVLLFGFGLLHSYGQAGQTQLSVAEQSSEAQRNATFFNEFVNAPLINKASDALRGIPDYSVVITLDSEAQKKISEVELKRVVEHHLRDAGVSVNPKSGYMVEVNIGVMPLTSNGGQELIGYVFGSEVNVMIVHPISLRSGFVRVPVAIWQSGISINSLPSVTADSAAISIEHNLSTFERHHFIANPQE